MTLTNVEQCVKGIAWSLLREQKEWLLRRAESEHASGLIHLIDHLQDAAVEDGLATEQEVFGDISS